MAVRAKIFNSTFRGKKYFRFFRKKLLVLKELGVVKKAYIINGYKILLKPLLDKILIWCPPGIHILHFKRSTYVGPPFVPAEHAKLLGHYTHDNYGYQKEKQHRAPDIEHAFGADEYFSFSFDGWPGHFLTIAGGEDIISCWVSAINGLAEHVALTGWINPVTEDNARWFLGDPNGGGTYYSGVTFGSCATITNDAYLGLCTANYYYEYTNFGLVNPKILLALSTHKALASKLYGYELDTSWQSFIPPADVTDPPADYWSDSKPVWVIAWHYPAVSDDVLLFVKYEYRPNFAPPNTYYAFYNHQFSLAAVHPTYVGGCLGSTVTELIELAGEGYDAQNLTPLPTHKTDLVGEKSRNIAFPTISGSVVLINYPNVEEELPPITVVINPNGTASATTSYSIPYTQHTYSFPILEPVDIQNGLYLYWEEHLFGREIDASEYSKIYNIRYGQPFGGIWSVLPLPPIDYDVSSFTVYTFTAEEQILQAVLYRNDPDPDLGGMYTALFDTNKSNDWIIGKRFAADRLERCQVQVYGEHPYTLKQREYRGTRFGWPFLYIPDGDERVL